MGRKWSDVRLPVGPLLAISGAKHAVARQRYGTVEASGVPAPITSLATRIGFRRESICRWVREGGIPIHQADVAAVRCGFHASEVWGLEWWSACFAQERLETAATEHRQGIVSESHREWVRDRDRLERWWDRANRERRTPIDGNAA